MRGGRLFRWLWRFNAIVIALVGVLAAVILSIVAFTSANTNWGPRHERRAAPTSEEQRPALVLRVDERALAGARLVAVLVEESDERYVLSGSLSGERAVVRNLVLFDLAGGDGKRVFGSDEGEVGRRQVVDSACRTVRDQWGDEGEVEVSAPVAIIALWGAPNEESWRLGVIDLPSGAWREVGARIDSLDLLQATEGGACLAVVERDGALASIVFGVDPEAAVKDRALSFP